MTCAARVQDDPRFKRVSCWGQGGTLSFGNHSHVRGALNEPENMVSLPPINNNSQTTNRDRDVKTRAADGERSGVVDVTNDGRWIEGGCE